MLNRPADRRQFMARLMRGAAIVAAPLVPGRLLAAHGLGALLTDGVLTIEVDAAMRSRLLFNGKPLTALDAGEALRLADGETLSDFLLLEALVEPVSGPHGKGRRHVLRGSASGRVEREMRVTFLDRYPGLALVDLVYRNSGKVALAVSGWHALTHDILPHPRGAWSFSGASYPDRRDWVQPVTPDFDQRNFMGMNGSDYGGGTPVAVVWRPDAGIAVGHIETVPKLVSLPIASQPGGTRLGIGGEGATLLGPGERFATPTLFVAVHEGDYFRPLDTYRRLMAEKGLAASRIPDASYAPVWCAWGYERAVTPDQVYGTLSKAKALGLEWVVLDDGWQTAEGDWKLNPAKFPGGDADMRAFTARIRAEGMRPRLWIAPLAVDRDTDLLAAHPDMLLLDRDGAAQNVTFWNSFTLCPAYAPTVAHFRAIIRRIIGDWGFEGVKIDGQHLNGVAPCYNPAHRHERPEESVEKLQLFWKAIHAEAVAINPDAVIEICPCGDSFAFHNIPAMNHTPASDPLSSWQIRHKGKTFKALMGPSAPYAGDHVELSDGGRDFASSYGVGAVLSTKFTWPRDTDHPTETLPPGGFVLTPEKEALWRQWIALYRANMLPKGTYRGELYDIGFDRPEAHVVAAGGSLHYAFYADRWEGPVVLRGLEPAQQYELTDAFTRRPLGLATGEEGRIDARFEKFLLVEARPVAGVRA